MFSTLSFRWTLQNSRWVSSKSVFSCELEHTLHPDSWSQKLVEYAALVPRLTASFRQQKSTAQTLREGHCKTSFVYLLIDPRVAENLVGESNVGE